MAVLTESHDKVGEPNVDVLRFVDGEHCAAVLDWMRRSYFYHEAARVVLGHSVLGEGVDLVFGRGGQDAELLVKPLGQRVAADTARARVFAHFFSVSGVSVLAEAATFAASCIRVTVRVTRAYGTWIWFASAGLTSLFVLYISESAVPGTLYKRAASASACPAAMTVSSVAPLAEVTAASWSTYSWFAFACFASVPIFLVAKSTEAFASNSRTEFAPASASLTAPFVSFVAIFTFLLTT